eukprot:NODE_7405_length_1581_cov_6.681568.p1 GENE.NODE_7405_length_1581_cov_6.681568~~NODE_7405_length_1581_cov_6.681568.p1  ORF type:complete len:412 (+),score=69.01 NODE_7405_length_1581_cov_6.681568:150-1385(+)
MGGEGEEKSDEDKGQVAKAPSLRCLCQGSILVILSLQNSVGILLNSEAMKPTEPGAVRYNPQSGVIMQELIKITACLGLVIAAGEPMSALCSSGYEVLRSGVPGFFFLLQNNLTLVAVQHLSPTEFAVTQKLRVFFAALLSVRMLGATVSRQRWLCLIVLVVGVAMVQLSFTEEDAGDADPAANLQDPATGLGATFLASFISALAGVYCEKMLKESQTSLWVRNVHFAFYGSLIGLFGLVATGSIEQVMNDGFFGGYNSIVTVSVINNSLGGILVSLALKHSGNIAANLSQTASLVLLSVFSVVVTGREAGTLFVLGVTIVCGAMLIFGFDRPLSCAWWEAPCGLGDSSEGLAKLLSRYSRRRLARMAALICALSLGTLVLVSRGPSANPPAPLLVLAARTDSPQMPEPST